MVCILEKRKARVPVLSFKNSNAPILSVEFSFFLHNLQLCYSYCGVLARGHQVLKRKGKEKLARPPYQKMSLLSRFFPVFSFKNSNYY